MAQKVVTQKSLIKRYHVLCGKIGMSAEERKAALGAYGVSSSVDLSLGDIRDLCDKLERDANPAKAQRDAELDKWRKRLMASIGGWLRAMGYPEGGDYIKAIACRASECKRFNDVPLERLRSLYYAYSKKRKDMEVADALTMELLQGMSEVNKLVK